MLITGGSQGIGQAIAEYFQKDYDIVTVSRSKTTTESGDLTNKVFRDYLIEKYQPKIFINNAGIVSESSDELYEINVVAACHLAEKFYSKMEDGHIINMCSISGNKSSREDETMWRSHYKASKTALKSLSKSLSYKKTSSVKVTSIEPDWINTGIGNKKIYKIDYDKSNDINYFAPMPPSYIAEVIDWILKQPPYVVISSIELSNFFKNKSRDSAILA